MDRRKRMHGKKRRSPVKLSQMWVGDGPPPSAPTTIDNPMKPQGENATNYNPDGQAGRMHQMMLLAQKQMREQMQSQQSQGGGGSHTHSVKVDGHSDSGGYQSQGRPNPYNWSDSIRVQNRGLFGSGVQEIMNFGASPMAKKKKLKKKK